jgi:phosphoribosyl-ATP pyrophosphohydrolase/phosphoribosyl-AMP cyclohydrolase/histidinol dehydrogenase
MNHGVRSTPLLRRLCPEDLRTQNRVPVSPEILEQAREIVERVQHEGEAALRRFAQRLDDCTPGQPLRIESEELQAQFRAQEPSTRALLERTAERIRHFARKQREALQDIELPFTGGSMGHTVKPVSVAGCYAPGGRFPLPSTVLMTAIPARVAGVQTIIVASPRPSPVSLAAAWVAQADAVVRVGGAHAIAAMAHGTESVPTCDVIVGPGNAWVTAAKQIVGGRVRIDSLAGPSELLVVAGRDTDPDWVAADLLAQAEHDPLAVPGLLALDAVTVAAVERSLHAQLSELPTASIASESMRRQGFACVVNSAEEAAALCNLLAPEHLQWMIQGHDELLPSLHSYGALFVGRGSAEVLGDYGAGPNHVLPTGGSGRARGGLSVLDFLKIHTWLRVEDPAACREIVEDAATLAGLEGLPGHERAALKRLR